MSEGASQPGRLQYAAPAMSFDPAPPARPHILRRQYLLDAGFQLRYMLRLAALGGGGVMLVGVLAWRSHQSVLEQGATPEALALSGETMLWLTGLGALAMAGVLALFGLVLTHRVAGPVYVMNLYLAALAAGRFPRMRPLRRRDELRGFFSQFSGTVDRLREREAEEARLLSEVIDALAPVASTQDAQAALRILGSLQARKRQAIEGPTSGALKSVA